MKFKKYNHLLTIVLFSFITIISYLWFSQTKYFQAFAVWTEQNRYLFLSTLLLIKVVGIIWPPIPGGLLTLGAIPIIGWQMAYAIDLTGTIFGSSVAYFLGKKYGFAFLEKLFDKETLKRIKNFKVKKNREVEAVILLRVLLGTTIVEAVSYAAGLIKIRFNRFFIGAIISHMIIGIPIFYFAGSLLGGKNFILNIAVLLLAIPLLWKFRTRYFE